MLLVSLDILEYLAYGSASIFIPAEWGYSSGRENVWLWLMRKRASAR